MTDVVVEETYGQIWFRGVLRFVLSSEWENMKTVTTWV